MENNDKRQEAIEKAMAKLVEEQKRLHPEIYEKQKCIK